MLWSESLSFPNEWESLGGVLPKEGKRAGECMTCRLSEKSRRVALSPGFAITCLTDPSLRA